MAFPGIMYVGFVLIINSLYMMGKISAKAIVPMNIFTASLLLSTVVRIMFYTPDATMDDFSVAAAICLFAFTYLYVAANQIFKLDPKGLGWYCLPVSCFAVPLGFWALPDVGMAILWWMWASLWFMFFLLFALKKNIESPTKWWSLANGIATGGSAFAILNSHWPWLHLYT